MLVHFYELSLLLFIIYCLNFVISLVILDKELATKKANTCRGINPNIQGYLFIYFAARVEKETMLLTLVLPGYQGERSFNLEFLYL